jgi:UDP-MurNAc hydroxylase
MDPWLSRRGAFQAAWYQFPSNHDIDIDSIVDIDWVTVSHEHLDHMDVEFLSRLPDCTRVLIHAYESPNLRERLHRAGVRNVIEVDAWKRFDLNPQGDWLTFIPEESPMCQDAAVLVSAGGSSLLHVNDARLTVAQARRASLAVGGHVDVLAMQASGASWHPICYEYPPEEMLRISGEKRLGKFKAVARLIRAVRPTLAVPFAGPVCFLDPDLRHHNRWIQEPGIFPDLKQQQDWLSEHLAGQLVRHWLPGDTYEVGSGRYEAHPRWAEFEFGDVDEYLDSYASARRTDIERELARYEDPDDDLGERLEDHFARLGEMSPYFLRRIAMTVRFEVDGPGGGRWDVHVGPDRVRMDRRGRAPEVQYRFRVASKWLLPVVEGRIGWEDLLLSLRFSAWRDPDIYNDYLVGLLKHAEPHVLAAVEAYEGSRGSDERVLVEASTGRFAVSRYCPHAGEDLTEGAVIVDGKTLRCLGHNFEFDLETGECINARCEPLATSRRTAAGTNEVLRVASLEQMATARAGSPAPAPLGTALRPG